MRKSFSTSIEEDIQNEFKEVCKKNEIKINEVLEALMKAYNKGKISVKASFEIDFDYQSK